MKAKYCPCSGVKRGAAGGGENEGDIGQGFGSGRPQGRQPARERSACNGLKLPLTFGRLMIGRPGRRGKFADAAHREVAQARQDAGQVVANR
jgi:hypothetical protein